MEKTFIFSTNGIDGEDVKNIEVSAIYDKDGITIFPVPYQVAPYMDEYALYYDEIIKTYPQVSFIQESCMDKYIVNKDYFKNEQ